LDANLVIKPALDPTAKVNPEQTGGLFEKAIINSSYTHDGIVPPVYPSFEDPGMEMTLVDAADFVRYFDESEEGKKTRIARLGDDDTLTMKVQAVIADAGVLTYKWKFRPDGSTAWEDAPVDGVSEVTEPAKLAVDPVTKKPYLNFRDAYFNADGTPYVGYEVPVDASGAYDNSLYEKYSTYTIKSKDEGGSDNVAGTYAAVATNTISNLTKDKWSTYCYLPGPKEIKFAESGTFTVTTDAEGKSHIAINLVEDNNNPTITEVWYYDALSKDTPVNSAKAGSGIAESPADMDAMKPGWYAARVVANLNRKNAEKCTPEAQVIYAQPVIADVKPEAENPAYNLAPGATQELKLQVDVPLPAGFETEESIAKELYRNLSYEWQYRRSDSTAWRNIVPSMASETDITALIHSIDNENGSITVRNVEDMTAYQYRCIVTNTLGKNKVSMTQSDASLFLVY
jgi:hypothetical protein